MKGKWKDWYAWSRSRQSLLNTCPRKFYYRYVRFYNVDHGDTLKDIKRKLDRMYESKFLLGSIVHGAIKRQFDQLSRGRPAPGYDAAINYVSRVIDNIRDNPDDYIIEALNGKEIKEKEISKIGTEAKKRIDIFFNEIFDSYKNLEIITYDQDYQKINIEGDIFWLVPDLITRSNDGRVYITDWKTDSSFSDAIDDWQMKLYILWALEEGLSDMDHLRAEVVFLDTGESKAYNTTQQEIDSFKRELITKSKELFEYINSKSGEADFEKCENEVICLSCGFKSYCEAR